jgi:hypothetical protein
MHTPKTECALFYAPNVPCSVGAANFREEIFDAVFRAPMASKFLRLQTWWLKLRHPVTGALIRQSLETTDSTTDSTRAELLRKRVEIEVALLQPCFQNVELPAELRTTLGLPSPKPLGAQIESPSLLAVPAPLPPASAPVFVPRVTVDQAVVAYLRYIASDNAAMHIATRSRCCGDSSGQSAWRPLVDRQKPRDERRTTNDRKSHVADPAPFFVGIYLDEITTGVVQDFMESLNVSFKTWLALPGVLSPLFEVCMKPYLFRPTNIRYPNPIGALPSYSKRKHTGGIVFLNDTEIAEVLAILALQPVLRIAAAIMIYAGLRRSEALWLARDPFPRTAATSPSFIAVTKKTTLKARSKPVSAR